MYSTSNDRCVIAKEREFGGIIGKDMVRVGGENEMSDWVGLGVEMRRAIHDTRWQRRWL